MSLEDLSDTEIEVLKAVDHVGWYGQLWFPGVFRDALDFPDGPDDEEIHRALNALIRSGYLEVWRIEGEDAIRMHRVTPEMILELQKHSTVADLSLRVRQDVRADVEARWRRKWNR